MSADRLVRGLRERGEAAAGAAKAAAVQVVAARVAALPGVAVIAADDAIVLQAPGLVARAFGSRTRAGDARLLGILGDSA